MRARPSADEASPEPSNSAPCSANSSTKALESSKVSVPSPKSTCSGSLRFMMTMGRSAAGCKVCSSMETASKSVGWLRGGASRMSSVSSESASIACTGICPLTCCTGSSSLKKPRGALLTLCSTVLCGVCSTDSFCRRVSSFRKASSISSGSFTALAPTSCGACARSNGAAPVSASGRPSSSSSKKPVGKETLAVSWLCADLVCKKVSGDPGASSPDLLVDSGLPTGAGVTWRIKWITIKSCGHSLWEPTWAQQYMDSPCEVRLRIW
mmetsp:Transcript_17799/g.32223  ORF Transcript_17799/g.32223 Transcript_17799/m.32223 type:complete len:267 (-) Transcript_17799:28-828(-)